MASEFGRKPLQLLRAQRAELGRVVVAVDGASAADWRGWIEQRAAVVDATSFAGAAPGRAALTDARIGGDVVVGMDLGRPPVGDLVSPSQGASSGRSSSSKPRAGVCGSSQAPTRRSAPTGLAALTDSGEVVCWGWNIDGLAEAPPGRYSAISDGLRHKCALSETGQAVCWGNNSSGQTDVPPGRYVAIASARPPCARSQAAGDPSRGGR